MLSLRRPFARLSIIAGLLAAVLLPAAAKAALPELKIAPLRYDQHLELGRPKTGIIDASNPTGSKVHVKFEVQAFRQTGRGGELEYYDDERLSSAITPAIREFDLGPREAIRTKFTIDPNRLGPGAAYGVIFLRTIPSISSSSSDPSSQPSGQSSTSARVGTLLILDVGGQGAKAGQITRVTVPGLVYGQSTLPAQYAYANTGQGKQALAFAPSLTAAVGWFGKPQELKGPFVFPDRERTSTAELTPGNRVGIVPITFRDRTGSAASVTRYAFMVTGLWVWLFPLLVILAGILLLPVSLARRLWRFALSRRHRSH